MLWSVGSQTARRRSASRRSRSGPSPAAGTPTSPSPRRFASRIACSARRSSVAASRPCSGYAATPTDTPTSRSSSGVDDRPVGRQDGRDRHRPPHGGCQPRGDGRERLRRIETHHGCEPVGAEPGGDRRVARDQPARQVDQQPVAGRVSQRGIDVLEPVDVQHAPTASAPAGFRSARPSRLARCASSAARGGRPVSGSAADSRRLLPRPARIRVIHRPRFTEDERTGRAGVTRAGYPAVSPAGCATARAASGPSASSTFRPSSSRIGTFSDTALSYFEPGESPTTTKPVFFDTEPLTLPPRSSISSVARSRE